MTEPVDFGAELKRLEEIVRALEADDLDLDRALKLFEEGVTRLQRARGLLAAADAKVKQVLTDAKGKLTLGDFDAPPSSTPSR